MAAKFTSIEAREALAKRLMDLCNHMLRSMDQGHHNQINVSMEMIGDVQAAASVVALADVDGPERKDHSG